MEQMKVQTTAIDAKKQKAAPPSEPTAMKKQKAAPPSESMMDMIVFDTKQKMKEQMDMIVLGTKQKIKEQMDMIVFNTKEQMDKIVFNTKEQMDKIVFNTKHKMKDLMDIIVYDTKQKMAEQMDMTVFDKIAEQMDIIVFDKMAEQMDTIFFDTKQKMAEQMDMIVFDTRQKMAAAPPEPEPPFKDADFPILYLQVGVSSSSKTHTCTWHSLDLNLGKAALMDFDSDFYFRSVALSFKSEIFILGGYHPPNHPQDRGCRVLRFDTAKPSYNRRFTFSTSVPNSPPAVQVCNCAALSDKIYFFLFGNRDRLLKFPLFEQRAQAQMERLKRFDREGVDGLVALDVYDPSSNQWHSYTEAELKLPNQLKRIDPDIPVLSDSLNNRLLAYYPTEGLYAFSPDTFKWKLLHQNKLHWSSDFQYSAVINGVLFGCNMSGDIRGAMSAFDLEDNLQPLTMVWPQHDKDYYRFYYNVQWKSPIDLGNGRVCLLNEVTEDVNPAYRRKSYFYSYNDPEYINSSAYEHDAAIPRIAKRGESKFMLVLSGMILEVEKKSGSKGNMELWVNKAIRVRYEFDYFPLSKGAPTRVFNIVPVARP